MEFYQRFAKYYDTIFPLDVKQVDFLQGHLISAKHVLDLGCATGEYTIALHSRGYQIKGLDLSQLMIEEAKKKADKLNLKDIFYLEDMQKLNEENMYDGMYSIGNTIVHLKSIEAIYETFKRCYRALKPKATIILQMINYERILEKDIHTLPPIQKPGVSLLRRYNFKLPLIDFNTTLMLDDEIIEHTTQLFPLTAQALVIILKSIGFKAIQSFDGFSNQPYDKDTSYQLVMVAKKDE